MFDHFCKLAAIGLRYWKDGFNLYTPFHSNYWIKCYPWLNKFEASCLFSPSWYVTLASDECNLYQKRCRWFINSLYSRSSRLEVYYEKGILQNVVKFTGKHLLWSPIIVKLKAWAWVYVNSFFWRHIVHASAPQTLLLEYIVSKLCENEK